MGSVISKITKIASTHKVACVACTCTLVLCLGVGGVGVANALRGSISESQELDYGEQAIYNTDSDEVQSNTEVQSSVDESSNSNESNTSSTISTDNSNTTGNSATSQKSSGGTQEHTHSWAPITYVEHHDAKYSTEIIWLDPPGGYECNACGYVARTGEACSEHTATAGHGGWHSYQGKKQQVWHVVQDAYDETVVAGYYCTQCGARQ